MKRLAFVVNSVAVASLAGALTLLHHGHIVMFLTDVRARLRDAKEMEDGRVQQEPSKLEVHFGDPDAHYIVAVHRKTRSLEVGLHFEGTRENNERRLQTLADRGATLRGRLGKNVELEQWNRGWTRVHDSTVLSRGDWSPKRELTPQVVEQTSKALLRFIRVLQPIIDGRDGPRTKRRAG